MIYTNIPAMYRKDAATLVDVVTNLKYRGLKPAEVEIYKKAVENKDVIVILPIKYSLEHYKDNEIQIGSFCEYSTFDIIGQNEKNAMLTDISIGYKCLNRCYIKDIVVENNKVFVEVDHIENQKFEPQHEEIKKEIFDRFKEYLKYADVALSTVESVKSAEDVEMLIKYI